MLPTVLEAVHQNWCVLSRLISGFKMVSVSFCTCICPILDKVSTVSTVSYKNPQKQDFDWLNTLKERSSTTNPDEASRGSNQFDQVSQKFAHGPAIQNEHKIQVFELA